VRRPRPLINALVLVCSFPFPFRAFPTQRPSLSWRRRRRHTLILFTSLHSRHPVRSPPQAKRSKAPPVGWMESNLSATFTGA